MNKPLTIEIHGTGTHNRGAELMAMAIADRLRTRFPDVRLVVSPTFGSGVDRARHGFLTTWEVAGRWRRHLDQWALPLCGQRTRDLLGVVDPAEIDVVLDASGFAFSDQWGTHLPAQLLAKMQRTGRCKAPLILLPQALGPFQDAAVADRCRTLFQRCQAIFARDRVSLAAIQALAPELRTIQMAPDFTIGMTPQPTTEVDLPASFVAVVPNFRMLDKGGQGDHYLNFLRNTLHAIQQSGRPVVIVQHDAREDRRVVARLGDAAAGLPVVTHRNPRVLKWILSQATFVVASRFHAIVSSLSTGVPCLAAGWSHKYPELLRDFDAAELLIDNLDDEAACREKVALLSAADSAQAIRLRLAAAAQALKHQVANMWQQVEELIQVGRS